MSFVAVRDLYLRKEAGLRAVRDDFRKLVGVGKGDRGVSESFDRMYCTIYMYIQVQNLFGCRLGSLMSDYIQTKN